MHSLHITQKKITLRPVRESDDSFLRRAFQASREEEFRMVKWDFPEQEAAFFRHQFDAQALHFKRFFALSEYHIIEFQRKFAGRLLVDWQDRNVHILDLTLLPEYQKQGIGSAIIDAVIIEADKSGISASVMYEKNKPYMEKFYNGFGFSTVKEYPAHFSMERKKLNPDENKTQPNTAS